MAYTQTKKSKKKYVVASIGAVGAAALVGAGVFATSLTISGSQGTQLQAGAASPSAVSGCQSSTMNVEETYDGSTLNTSTGYTTPAKTGYKITNIAEGCVGKTITLAVKSDANGTGTTANEYSAVGSATAVTSGHVTSGMSISDTSRGGTVTGYSIKIS